MNKGPTPNTSPPADRPTGPRDLPKWAIAASSGHTPAISICRRSRPSSRSPPCAPRRRSRAAPSSRAALPPPAPSRRLRRRPRVCCTRSCRPARSPTRRSGWRGGQAVRQDARRPVRVWRAGAAAVGHQAPRRQQEFCGRALGRAGGRAPALHRRADGAGARDGAGGPLLDRRARRAGAEHAARRRRQRDARRLRHGVARARRRREVCARARRAARRRRRRGRRRAAVSAARAPRLPDLAGDGVRRQHRVGVRVDLAHRARRAAAPRADRGHAARPVRARRAAHRRPRQGDEALRGAGDARAGRDDEARLQEVLGEHELALRGRRRLRARPRGRRAPARLRRPHPDDVGAAAAAELAPRSASAGRLAVVGARRRPTPAPTARATAWRRCSCRRARFCESLRDFTPCIHTGDTETFGVVACAVRRHANSSACAVRREQSSRRCLQFCPPRCGRTRSSPRSTPTNRARSRRRSCSRCSLGHGARLGLTPVRRPADGDGHISKEEWRKGYGRWLESDTPGDITLDPTAPLLAPHFRKRGRVAALVLPSAGDATTAGADIRLLSARKLVAYIDGGGRMAIRQTLEAAGKDIFLDAATVRGLLPELAAAHSRASWRSATRGSRRLAQLAQLRPVLVWWMCERARRKLGYDWGLRRQCKPDATIQTADFGVFIDFMSMHLRRRVEGGVEVQHDVQQARAEGVVRPRARQHRPSVRSLRHRRVQADGDAAGGRAAIRNASTKRGSLERRLGDLEAPASNRDVPASTIDGRDHARRHDEGRSSVRRPPRQGHAARGSHGGRSARSPRRESELERARGIRQAGRSGTLGDALAAAAPALERLVPATTDRRRRGQGEGVQQGARRCEDLRGRPRCTAASPNRCSRRVEAPKNFVTLVWTRGGLAPPGRRARQPRASKLRRLSRTSRAHGCGRCGDGGVRRRARQALEHAARRARESRPSRKI